MRATITMGMRPTGGRTRADGRAVGSHLHHSFRGRPFAHSVRPPSVVVVVTAVTWGNIVNFSVTGAACCAEPSASSPPIRARSRRSRRCLGCSLVFFSILAASSRRSRKKSEMRSRVSHPTWMVCHKYVPVASLLPRLLLLPHAHFIFGSSGRCLPRF